MQCLSILSIFLFFGIKDTEQASRWIYNNDLQTWQVAMETCLNGGGVPVSYHAGFKKDIPKEFMKLRVDVWTADYARTVTKAAVDGDSFRQVCGFQYLDHLTDLSQGREVMYGDCLKHRYYFHRNDRDGTVEVLSNNFWEANLNQTFIPSDLTEIKPGFYWSGESASILMEDLRAVSFIPDDIYLCGAYMVTEGHYFSFCSRLRTSICLQNETKSIELERRNESQMSQNNTAFTPNCHHNEGDHGVSDEGSELKASSWVYNSDLETWKVAMETCLKAGGVPVSFYAGLKKEILKKFLKLKVDVWTADYARTVTKADVLAGAFHKVCGFQYLDHLTDLSQGREVMYGDCLKHRYYFHRNDRDGTVKVLSNNFWTANLNQTFIPSDLTEIKAGYYWSGESANIRMEDFREESSIPDGIYLCGTYGITEGHYYSFCSRLRTSFCLHRETTSRDVSPTTLDSSTFTSNCRHTEPDYAASNQSSGSRGDQSITNDIYNFMLCFIISVVVR